MSVLSSISNGFQALLPAIGTGIGALAGGPTGAIIGGSIATGGLNFWNQQQNLDYQKHLQNVIFNREDSSIQRRVADLRAAGLSPVLAAGQGASSGNVVRTESPTSQNIDVLGAMSLLKMKQDISMTEIQKDLIKSQIAGNMINNSKNLYDFEWFKKRGVPTNASGMTKDILQGLGAVTSNQVKSALGTVKDKVQSVLPDRDNPELDKTGIDRIMEWWNSK